TPRSARRPGWPVVARRDPACPLGDTRGPGHGRRVTRGLPGQPRQAGRARGRLQGRTLGTDGTGRGTPVTVVGLTRKEPDWSWRLGFSLTGPGGPRPGVGRAGTSTDLSVPGGRRGPT